VIALAQWLEPRVEECLRDDFRVLTSDLMKVWNCTESSACRRINTIVKHDLAGASRLSCKGAWVFTRLGPVD